MVLLKSAFILQYSAFLASGQSLLFPREPPTTAEEACILLNTTFPELTAFPGSLQFDADIEHYAFSSSQNSTCSVEPRDADDISTILKIISKVKSPFAVKSGGHAYNIKHSSTTGVQISMAKFTSLEVDEEKQTATVGVGLTWDKVYEQMEPSGFVVAGGRVPGVGVGGVSLGGGYTWKTNQVGLTVDTIVSHDIVLPSGQQIRTSNTSNSDLFFALKGGLNNFGIVTSITYELFPQGPVFGGVITFPPNVTDIVTNATAIFSLTNTDPKAQVIVTYAYTAGQLFTTMSLMYDGPTAPPGVLDSFLAIPSLSSDVATRSFSELLLAAFPNDANPFGSGNFVDFQQTVPIINYTVPVLKEIATQVETSGTALSAQLNGSDLVVTFSTEPFLSPNSHSRGGAYPHPPSRQVTPSVVAFVYRLPAGGLESSTQMLFVNEVKKTTNAVQTRAVEEGQSRWDDILYPNYAFADTPLELLYGPNVPRLKQIAKKYDPDGVMRLTGGFKLEN